MNNLQLYGRLTRDPEIRFSKTGLAVTTFTLAIDAGKNKPANFIVITAFGKTAELVANHVLKGHRLLVNGHLQSGTYEKDGHKVFKLDVICDNIKFIETKNDIETKKDN